MRKLICYLFGHHNIEKEEEVGRNTDTINYIVTQECSICKKSTVLGYNYTGR